MLKKAAFYLGYIKRIARSSGVYAGIDILNRATSFFLLPILTRYLSPFNYGILATFQASYSMGESFINMGSTAAVTRSYFDRKHEGPDFRLVVFNSVIVKLLFLAVFSVVLFSQWRLLTDVFKFPPWLIALLPFIAFASAFTDTAVRLWIAQEKVRPYSIFQFSSTLTNVTLSLIFIMVLGLGLMGRVGAIAVTETAAMIFCLFLFLRKKLFKFDIDPAVIRRIMLFGAPLFVHGIGRWVITVIDRFFLTAMVDASATGIYSVAYSVGSVIEFIAGATGLAIMPILFEKLRDATHEQKEMIVKFSYIYFSAIFIMTLGWVLVSPYLLGIFVGESFRGAAKYISWIAFSYFLNAVFRIVSLFIMFTKKTYYLTCSVIAAAVVNVALDYILIKANGILGAAQATLISYAINLFFACFFMQKAYPMPWLPFAKARVRPQA